MRPLTSNKWLKFENIDNTKCWWACGATEILLHCQWKIQNGTATLENKLVISYRDFPDSSVGKESTCNSGDPGLIPGSGRSAREGIGYPLQYSWASLAAQLVKNPPAMRETWVRSYSNRTWIWFYFYSTMFQEGFMKKSIQYNILKVNKKIWFLIKFGVKIIPQVKPTLQNVVYTLFMNWLWKTWQATQRI